MSTRARETNTARISEIGGLRKEERAIVYILASSGCAKAPKRIALTAARAPLSPAEKKSGTVFTVPLFRKEGNQPIT